MTGRSFRTTTVLLALALGIALLAPALADDAPTRLTPLSEAELGSIHGAWGGDPEPDPEPQPEPEPEPEPELELDAKTDIDVYVGNCFNPLSFSYRFEAYASTETRPSADYLAAKVTLKINGVVRGNTDPTEREGPANAVSDSVSASLPCYRAFPKVRASGWHKGVLGDQRITKTTSASRG